MSEFVRSIGGLLPLGIVFAVTGCLGVANQHGAAIVTTSAVTVASVGTCHVERFVADVAPRLQTSCISCHATGRQFQVAAGSTDSENIQNLNAIVAYIESTAATVEKTTLMYQISPTSESTHPYKISPSDTTFYDFVNGLLNNPSCEGTSGSSSSSSADDGSFF